MALEDLLNNKLIQQVLFAMLFTYTSSVCLFVVFFMCALVIVVKYWSSSGLSDKTGSTSSINKTAISVRYTWCEATSF